MAPGAADFRLDEWHEYHLTAHGPDLALRINGKLVAECTDDDPQQFEPLGVLAMQLHTGPPMKAQFRNLRIKRLTPACAPSPRDVLLATAALDWQLGERLTAHQPPLEATTAKIVPELPGRRRAVRMRTPRSRGSRAAYFDGGKAWNTPGKAITVYLARACPTATGRAACLPSEAATRR